MANIHHPITSPRFRWTLIDLLGFFLWVFIVGISVITGGLGWVGILQEGINYSSIYIPEFVSQVFFYLGCVGVITKIITLWINRPLLTLIEANEYLYLGVLSGICFLCSLILPTPKYYDFAIVANTNRSLVAIAFGVAAVVFVIACALALRKHGQMLQIERNSPLAQESYFKLILHNISQNKRLFIWLLIAPLGLIIIPLLFALTLIYIAEGDPFTGWESIMLWGYYQEAWFIPPLIAGNIVSALGYGGKKLMSIKGGTKFRNIAYSVCGGLLILISIGVYGILLLVALFFTIYIPQ